MSWFHPRTRSISRSHLVFSRITLRSDTLAVPALLSASSALLLLIQFASTRKFVKNLFKVQDEEEFEPAVEQVPRGFVAKLRHHAECYGGVTIFVYRVLRFLAVLGLVGLAVATVVLGSKDDVDANHHCIRFLNWSVLGAYVRFISSADCRKSSPSYSSIHLFWL